MTAIIHSGVNWVKSWIPPAGTVNRTILYLWPFSAFIQQATDRNRTTATYAALGLQERLSEVDNPFIMWMERMNPALAEDSAINPARALVLSQMHDLICKVIVSAGFYATSHISLYATLTHLFSHSQKVAKVAQPLLDRFASIPVPRPLQSASVIAFAPVIVKLLHMALLAVDPKGENNVLELFKRGAEKVGKTLEFLWCLRFSLISLGISKNLYQSVASTLFSQALTHFVTNPQLQFAVKAPFLILNQTKGKEPTEFEYLAHLLVGTDSFWPTQGFTLGLQGMWSAFFASSEPCDVATLEDLHKQIAGGVSPAEIAKVRQLRNDIKQSVQQGKISESWAQALNDLIIEEGLKTFVEMEDFNEKVHKSFDIITIKELCFPTNDSITTFILLCQLTIAETDDLKKVSYYLQTIIHAKTLHDGAIDSIKGALFAKLFKMTAAIDHPNLNGDREVFFYGLMSLLPKFAVTPEQVERAYFVSQQFYINRLNLNLKWYLENRPADTEKQKSCEKLIFKIADKIQIEKVKQLPSYQKWLATNSCTHSDSGLKRYVKETRAFDFMRETVDILKDFEFATSALPYVLGQLSRDVNAVQDKWTFAPNFPEPISKTLAADAFPEFPAVEADYLAALDAPGSGYTQGIRDAAAD